MKHSKQQGFTLIELMIVVAILGILATIAIPAYQDYTKRAHVTEGLQLATSAKSAVTTYYSVNGKHPDSDDSKVIHTALGLAEAEKIKGNAVNSVSVGKDGLITIAYNEKVEDGKTLQLKPDVQADSGSFIWNCIIPQENGVNAKHAPSNCKPGNDAGKGDDA